MDNVYEVPNFLTAEEIAIFEDYLTNPDKWSSRSERRHDPNLGREIYTIFLPDEILNSIQARVEEVVGESLNLMSLSLVDYDARYGQPNLPPHFDGDQNSFIVDYQYKANTSWGLGVGSKLFEMTDNKAIIFNPNEYPHWRPHKTFQEGDRKSVV